MQGEDERPTRDLRRSESSSSEVETPSRRSTKRRRLTNESAERAIERTPTKIRSGSRADLDQVSSHGKVTSTPSKQQPAAENADKSARRRSRRLLIQNELDQDDDGQDELAARIAGELPDYAIEEDGGGILEKPSKPLKFDTDELPPGAEAYFEAFRYKSKQSNHTVSDMPSIEPAEMQQILDTMPDDFAPMRKKLYEKYRSLFLEWSIQIEAGFNACFYGYGSKLRLVFELADTYFPDDEVFVVNGYMPRLTIKDILSNLATELDETARASVQLEDTIDLIKKKCETIKNRLIMVVNNIDGEALRNEKAQAAFAELASHKKISLIASVDHVNAPLLWDMTKVAQLKFIWHHTPTYAPYNIEIPIEGTLQLSDNGPADTLRAIKYVLSSLTENARGIFRVLVASQLESMQATGEPSSEKHGMEYKSLYRNCSMEFLATNDLMFRTLLKEFYDHQMIRSKKDQVGAEVIWAPYKESILQEILDDEILAVI